MADGDALDLLGELYSESPRWQIIRRWAFTRGHPAIHTHAAIGYVPTRGLWFAQLRGTTRGYGTETTALAAVEKMMADYHEQVRHRYLYDNAGPLWQERDPR